MAEGKSWLSEEFAGFFGYGDAGEQGVKEWTISTLGPTAVGKTVMISGLYAQYHLGIESGKPIGIESVGAELHDMLADVARGLKRRPSKLPPNTREIRNALLKFMVRPGRINYQKIVSLQDHAGEHLRRTSRNHHETMEALRSSDSFMMFLDSRLVLRDDVAEASEEMELNLIKSLVRDVSGGLHDNDIIPIGVALSKADLVTGKEDELLERAGKLFESLSEELPQCIFCISPVSILKNPKEGDDSKFVFAPVNAEVPFLFCLATIVVRNASILRIEADRAKQERNEVQNRNLAGLGFFARIGAAIGKRVDARRLDLKSKRYVSLSDYDLKLAEAAYELLNVHDNVIFLQDGVIYDDVSDIVDELI